jgi:hypothetical protein
MTRYATGRSVISLINVAEMSSKQNQFSPHSGVYILLLSRQVHRGLQRKKNVYFCLRHERRDIENFSLEACGANE